MKQIKRKLLSLLLAMAMVCTLVPSALAEDSYKLEITGQNSVTAGTNLQLGTKLTKTADDGLTENVTGYSLSWSITENVTGLSIDASGLVKTTTATPIGNYTVTARATLTGQTQPKIDDATATITVTNTNPTFTITPTTATVEVGKTITLSTTPTTTVRWGSADSTIARVDSSTGVVTGVKAGTTTITATPTGGGTTATRTVTVTAASTDPEMTLSMNPTTLLAGSSATLTARITGTLPSGANLVTWSSNNAKVKVNPTSSTVNSNSASTTVTGEAGEKATITATLYNATTKLDEKTFDVTVSSTSTDYLTRVYLISGNTSIPTSGSDTLVASVSTSLANPDSCTVEWSSNNTAAVRVNNESNTATTPVASRVTTARTATMPVFAVGAGQATITATLKSSTGGFLGTKTFVVYVGGSGLSISLSGTPNAGTTVPIGYYNSNNYYTFTATPTVRFNGSTLTAAELSSNYKITYTWRLDSSALSNGTVIGSGTYSSGTYSLYANQLITNRNHTLSCYATIQHKTDSAIYATSSTISWTVNNNYNYNYGSISASATVYANSSGYSLGSTDDAGGTSIVSELQSAVSNYNGNGYYNGYYQGSNGYWYNSSGTLVSTDPNWGYNQGWWGSNWGWNGHYGYDTLRYVTFSNTSVTGGSLSASTGTKYYVGSYSSYGSYALENVVFTPSANYTSSASFSITAYGEYGTYTGTITFNMSGTSAGGSISLTGAAGENVSLSASDFTTWWRNMFTNGNLSYVTFTSISTGSLNNNGTSVVSASNPTRCYVSPSGSQVGLSNLVYVPSSRSTSTVTIRFTGYGSSTSTSSTSTSRTGTLTITYVVNAGTPITYSITGGSTSVSLNSSDFTAKYREVIGSTATNVNVRFRSVPTYGTLRYGSTTLTSSNINSYTFTTNSSGSARLSDVVYTPSAAGGSDTVEFACYSGSTLRFVGTIVFNSTAAAPQNVTVSYTSNGGAVAFNYTDFYYSNAAVQASTYITFGTPSSGSLTVNGSAVTSADRFTFANTAGYQYINNVTYRPASGYSGTVTIPFAAYNSNNTVAANGNVTITVTKPAVTVTFKDMGSKTSSNQWYYDEVNALVGKGIIGGYDDGTFRPNGNVTYGEALKLILLAAGHPEQPQGSGANWAVNYMSYAVSKGFLDSSASSKLGEPMNRNTIATVTAKAMGLTPVTSGTSPFVDSNDPYVLALHQAGIIAGNSSSGATYFEGSKNLTRAEISLIIYRMCDQQ